MDKSNQYRAYYLDSDGQKVEINAERIYVELSEGNDISIDLAKQESGIAIGDAEQHRECDEIPETFTVLTVQPGACNLIFVNAHKHKMNRDK